MSTKDVDDEVWARSFAPVENETLRYTLGPERRELAAAIEGWLPFVQHARTERKNDEWTPALHEMRRGLEIVARAVASLGDRAWTDLPSGVPLTTRSGHEIEVRFFTPS